MALPLKYQDPGSSGTQPGSQPSRTNSGVPSLVALCQRFLKVHLDDIEGFGNCPTALVLPIVEQADAETLLRLTKGDPFLKADTQPLFKKLCIKDFASVRSSYERGNFDSEINWRRLYKKSKLEAEFKLLEIKTKLRDSLIKEDERKELRTTREIALVQRRRSVKSNNPSSSSGSKTFRNALRDHQQSLALRKSQFNRPSQHAKGPSGATNPKIAACSILKLPKSDGGRTVKVLPSPISKQTGIGSKSDPQDSKQKPHIQKEITSTLHTVPKMSSNKRNSVDASRSLNVPSQSVAKSSQSRLEAELATIFGSSNPPSSQKFQFHNERARNERRVPSHSSASSPSESHTSTCSYMSFSPPSWSGDGNYTKFPSVERKRSLTDVGDQSNRKKLKT